MSFTLTDPDAVGAPSAGDRRRLAAVAALAIGLGVLELVLLWRWQGRAYWNFSDGAYAQSARQILHGLVPYRDFAAAQPPPVYYVGAALLWIHDGLTTLRLGLGLVDLITATLVGAWVWRLTGRPLLAVGALLAAPLLPISLNSHAQLIPETLAAPLLLGGGMATSRRGGGVAGGVLLGLAVLCKLAFALPAVLVVLVAARRLRAAGALVLTVAGLAVVCVAAFGSAVLRQAITAQLQVGDATLHYAGGLIVQGAWNEVALVLLAGAGLRLAWRRRSAGGPVTQSDGEAVATDLRTLSALALGGLVLGLTVFKRGSYIDVLTVADPPLLVLAACGLSWIGSPGSSLGRPGRGVAVLLVALVAVQSASLLLNPSDPWAAKRPGARSGLEWTAGPREVAALTHAARACPAGEAYSGAPYVAFLADRPMPGDQPDLFIISGARVDARFLARADADSQRCPTAVPAG